MGKRLNIQPQLVNSASPVNLLNGAIASLSGPIGFTPNEPRIVVKAISLTPLGGATINVFKGGSGGSVAGTQVLQYTETSANPHTISFDIDTVLDAADFLTAEATGSGGFVVNISAEIE